MMGDYTYTVPPKPRYDYDPTYPRRQSLRERLDAYLTASVRIDVVLKVQLLVLSFVTGIEDVATFIDFHAFSSNHTGNTILMGISASGMYLDFTASQYIAVSLTMFVLGGWVFGRLGNSIGCRRRWWLIVTNIFQSVTVFAAAGLRYWGNFPATSTGTQLNPSTSSLGVMLLLALSSGGQVAMARSLQIAEITTANATTVYVDLFMDRNLFNRRNRARNRRILFVLSLMGGSCAGALAHRRVGSAATLLITALGKAVVTFALLFNKTVENTERGGIPNRLQHAVESSEYNSQDALSQYGSYSSSQPVLAEGMFVNFRQNSSHPSSIQKSRVHIYADFSLWDLVVSYPV